MKGTSRTARRLLAVPVVVATALSVGPAFTGIAQAVPPTGSFLNPSTSGPGNVISDKLDGTDGTYRFLVRATDPDTGGTISSVQIQIEDGDADLNFETIGTATRVGTTDTYEFNWDVSAYTPQSDVDNDAGFVRALVTDGNGETNFVGGSGGQAVSFQDSTAPTAHITSPANGGTLGFFPTNSGANKTGLIAGTASSDVTSVTGYYTTSPAGTDPTWTACGTDASPAAATGGTKTFSINCDITTATATQVTGLAVRPNTTGSGDAVRVTGYGQTLQTFSISPPSDTQTVGFCNTYSVSIVDQNGRAIAGAPVQVQVKGANSGANGSATDPDLQDAIKFAENLPVEGTSSDPFGPAGGPTEAAAKCDGAAEPDGAPDDVDGTSALLESVLSGNGGTGPDFDNIAATKAITGSTAGNGQFKFSLALPASPTTSAGTYNISAFLDENGDNVQNSGEVGNTATKTYQAATADTLTATPPSATNVVGENHTVTGTLTDQNGNPIAGQVLTFKVTSGPSSTNDIDGNPSTPNGIIGQCTTGADGKCSKTYTSNTAGTDTIVVFIDGNGNLTPDGAEKQSTVTKTWINPAGQATCIDVEPGSATNPTTQSHVITAYVTNGSFASAGDVEGQNDCSGSPVAGIPVDFAITDDTPDAALAPNTSDTNENTERVTTNSSGIATVTLTDKVNTAEGQNAVRASVPGAGGSTANTNYGITTITQDFEDISSTGTSVPGIQGADDTLSPAVALPFAFTYYGTAQNQIYASSNGFIKFLNSDGDSGCCSGDPFPSTDTPNGGVVAGLWSDLDNGSIKYQTLGIAPNRRFVIQYDTEYYSSGNSVRFEIKLFEGSNTIEVHYGTTTPDSDTASGGVENYDGTQGVQYFRASNADVSNTAVRYTPNAAPAGRTSETVFKTWKVAGTATQIDCTPEQDRNIVGQSHTVTCTVTDNFNNPVSGVKVGLQVIYGPNSGADLDSDPTTPVGFFGYGTTGANGQVSGSYTGNFANSNQGNDVIDGWIDADSNKADNGDTAETVDSNGNGIVDSDDQSDSGELSDFVDKAWNSSANQQGGNVEIDMNPTTGANDTTPPTKNSAKCDANTGTGFGGSTYQKSASAPAGVVELVCVSAQGVDGKVLYGATVTLTSSGVGTITDNDGPSPSATTQTAVIDNDGFAEFYIFSNQAGTQTLQASISGVTDTDTATKSWGSLGARRISVANVGGSTATPGGTHQVRATVTDRLGNPVAGQTVNFTESGPGRFLNGTSTEPSTVTAVTGADGTVTVELTTLSSESGTETVTAALPTTGGVDECERAAGDPTGAPVGVCSASTSFTWTTGGPSTTFKILSPSAYYTTVVGGTFANFSGVGGAPGEVLTVHRKVGNGSYTTMAGPTVGSDGTWIYSLKVTTTTAVYFTGANGTTGVKVIFTTLNITYPSTYYFDAAKGQRVAIYGSGARPGDTLEIWTKYGNQPEFVKRTNTVTATSYGTWALRFNVYNTMAIYFRGVNGKSDVVVYRVS